MNILLMFLKVWMLPIIIIILIYISFLIPMLLLIKKYKPNYWLIIWLSVFEIYLIDLGFFLFSIKIILNQFTGSLFLFTILINFLFLFSVPVIIKKIFKLKLSRRQVYLTSLLFLSLQASYIYLIAYWMAAGVSKAFMNLG